MTAELEAPQPESLTTAEDPQAASGRSFLEEAARLLQNKREKQPAENAATGKRLVENLAGEPAIHGFAAAAFAGLVGASVMAGGSYNRRYWETKHGADEAIKSGDVSELYDRYVRQEAVRSGGIRVAKAWERFGVTALVEKTLKASEYQAKVDDVLTKASITIDLEGAIKLTDSEKSVTDYLKGLPEKDAATLTTNLFLLGKVANFSTGNEHQQVAYKEVFEKALVLVGDEHISAGLQRSMLQEIDRHQQKLEQSRLAEALATRQAGKAALGALAGSSVAAAFYFANENADETIATPEKIEQIATTLELIKDQVALKLSEVAGWLTGRLPSQEEVQLVVETAQTQLSEGAHKLAESATPTAGITLAGMAAAAKGFLTRFSSAESQENLAAEDAAWTAKRWEGIKEGRAEKEAIRDAAIAAEQAARVKRRPETTLAQTKAAVDTHEDAPPKPELKPEDVLQVVSEKYPGLDQIDYAIIEAILERADGNTPLNRVLERILTGIEHKKVWEKLRDSYQRGQEGTAAGPPEASHQQANSTASSAPTAAPAAGAAAQEAPANVEAEPQLPEVTLSRIFNYGEKGFITNGRFPSAHTYGIGQIGHEILEEKTARGMPDAQILVGFASAEQITKMREPKDKTWIPSNTVAMAYRVYSKRGDHRGSGRSGHFTGVFFIDSAAAEKFRGTLEENPAALFKLIERENAGPISNPEGPLDIEISQEIVLYNLNYKAGYQSTAKNVGKSKSFKPDYKPWSKNSVQ